MANTLRFKRGLAAGLPASVAGEPLFTTDTFDLYIGNGTTNTRFQKYIASGTTLQYLRGDGSLATFPTNIVTGTGVSGQVAYWSGTNTQEGNANLIYDAANNRLRLGGGADTSQRLQVTGDTLMKGSGATSATTALTVQNSGSTNLLSVRNDGYVLIGSGNSGTPLATLLDVRGGADSDYMQVARVSASSDRHVRLYANGQIIARSQSNTLFAFQFSNNDNSQASGNVGNFSLTNTFNPTSGTATYTSLQVNQTINQTGGANGITRGLYVSPTLTAAADWRSIEWSNNTGWGLYGAGTANNYFNGNVGIGVTPSAWWTANSIKALQFGGGSIISFSNDRLFIGQNMFFSAAGTETYINTAAASLYRQFAGGHNWYYAPSGTAGNAITFTNAMTLTNVGRLILGAGDSGELLQVNGTMKVTGATSIDGNTFNVDATNDRVGIGTASPATKLEIVGATGLQIRNGATDGFSFQQSTTNSWSWTPLTSGSNYNIQNSTVNIGTATANASALLQVDSAIKGFLPPRMTTVQKNVIVTPAAGLMVYDTTLNKLCVYTTAWETITSL